MPRRDPAGPGPKGPRGRRPGEAAVPRSGAALSPRFLPYGNTGTTAVSSVGRAEQKRPGNRVSSEQRRKRRACRRGGDADSPASPEDGQQEQLQGRCLGSCGGSARRGRGRACSCGRAPAAGQGCPRGARVPRKGRKVCSSRLSSQPRPRTTCVRKGRLPGSQVQRWDNIYCGYSRRGSSTDACCERDRRKNRRGKRWPIRAAPELLSDGFTGQQFGSNFSLQLISFKTSVQPKMPA